MADLKWLNTGLKMLISRQISKFLDFLIVMAYVFQLSKEYLHKICSQPKPNILYRNVFVVCSAHELRFRFDQLSEQLTIL